MGNLILSGNNVTMSSREIADLVEARHNDVISTIERLFSKDLLRSSRKTRKEATKGRPIDVYDLSFRDTQLVIAGYSDEHRAKVIDRWMELENKELQPAFKIPQTYAEALVVAGQQAMLAEQRLKELEVAKPKVDYFDDYVNTDNLKTVTMTGKEMGVSSQKLGKWFRTKGYAFKDKEKGIIWTQPFINKGYGVMKQFSRKDGGYSGTQAYLTPTGEVFVKANYESVQ